MCEPSLRIYFIIYKTVQVANILAIKQACMLQTSCATVFAIKKHVQQWSTDCCES